MPFCLEDRRVRGERAGLFISVGELARLDLARFDIRLIERIDADDGSGDGGRDLEAEELLGNQICRGEPDAHDGLTGALQRRHGLVLGRRPGARRRADK